MTVRGSLDAYEDETVAVLVPELRQHFEAIRLASVVLTETLRLATRARELPLAMRVAMSLLVRVINDLRCVALLAARGYPLQAGAIAASLFEEALTISYIGDSQARAEGWVDHEFPLDSYRSANELMREAVQHVPTEDAATSLEVLKKIYAQLCMTKHANPLLQKAHGVKETEDGFSLGVGPDRSATSVKAAWFVMEQAAKWAGFAANRFTQSHLPNVAHMLIGAHEDLVQRLGELHRIAVDRGWSEDPFPEGWPRRPPRRGGRGR